MRINSLTIAIFIVATTIIFSSCEQERLEPITTAANGGGAVESYYAYEIDSMVGQGTNVYGRIVFWKDQGGNTLIQVALHNTIDDTDYPTSILAGSKGSDTEEILSLYEVNGNSGEFRESKFYVIGDSEYFDNILLMNAHINIYLTEDKNTIVASGNLGVNNTPVGSE
ncbi:hypothetical protein LVD15_10035 [Fulvivirga maritima]|uniref:hypothetical protein n=1 Tax=Fulvivirga maritima TaxID=2904247 RepID=UPI001F427838|nr:hypothetical protein [Fulvivirga maritima]UII28741.1 hypothetical protein LVD15_10035 [Fulvivirga maritima]